MNKIKKRLMSKIVAIMVALILCISSFAALGLNGLFAFANDTSIAKIAHTL